jgi:cytochrome b subunit of formate dehydrogenase
MAKKPAIKIINGEKYFYRFSVNQRIQHIILALTVIVLILTGMPLKFYDAPWAISLYGMFGGIQAAPIVHKVVGSVMLILFVYHIGYLAYVIRKYQYLPLKLKEGMTTIKFFKLLANQPLIPNMKDARDIRDLLKYLLFLTDKRPDGANFTWKEKFDYWAPFWGIIIIGGSGLIMWNKVLATILIPGGAINFSLIAHSDEALLAALFLLIWHWYNVHFSLTVFPMGTVFLTGYLSEEIMVEEHYEAYVEIMKKEGLVGEILPPHGSHTQTYHEEGPIS